MGHYAKVVDGIVTNVIVADAEFIESYDDGVEGEWVKTSYNMRFGVYFDPETNEPAADQSVVNDNPARQRKNFAGIGWKYDGTGFIPPQPYDSWTLNNDSYKWEAPTPYPTDGNDYMWDEDGQEWVQMTEPETA